MAQYVNKSALVAEIEKLMEKYSKCQTRNNYEDGLKDGRLIGYKDALSKIDTLEVKDVDLEKEINEWMLRGCITDTRYNDYCDDDIIETAKHFFELGFKAKGGE